MSRSVKVGLSVLLLLCLADMPYGYFQFVRFVSMIFFAVFAYLAFEQDEKKKMGVFIFLAILFQPFFKIALGRTLWNIVDVIVAVWLITSLFIESKREK